MSTVSPDSVAQDQIRSFFDRWERLEGEKTAISDDLKELFAEAKGNGFDTKVLRKLFRDQVSDANERAEFESLYELYATALNGPRVRDARDAREDDEEMDPETGEFKPAGNGAGGAGDDAQVATVRASSSAQPLQQDSAEVARGAHNPEVAGSIPAPATKPAPRVDTDQGASDGSIVPTAPVASNVVALRKQTQHSDAPDPRCLKPATCGGFSNLGLCPGCRAAAGLQSSGSAA